ncbi:Myosin type-2 heavy chain 1 [Apophysomyces sp. BC1034]|nr:Myosin type-2 heavy chain 1 [Apophysomyces sp. BC1034]
MDTDKYQVGLTKILFRAGQLAYLGKLRTDRWNECAILLFCGRKHLLSDFKLKRKYLKDLRSEARSASHLKEMLYKLENKVVEHTQNLTYQKEDKAQLQAKTTKLEA